MGMIRTKAIKLQQGDIKMYLTKLKISEIKELLGKRQLIVDIYDPLNPTGREGYQRGIDETRVNDIANFLSKRLDILPSLLPSSVILNCRRCETIRYDELNFEIIINDDAVFHVVDGQHRIQGLERSKIQKYDIPLTIIEGLNIAQEAGQFLTINTKQKKVRPDLQLRILYHQDRTNTRKLIDILGVENWKIEALTLGIALNDKNESPWRNLILRPGEKRKRKGQWKPITEANFVDTLKFFCSSESTVKHIPLEEKERFLIQYWIEIRKIYEKAFTEIDGPDYSLTRGLGAGIFNTLAPAVYNLTLVVDDLPTILKPLKRKVPLDDWRRPRGRIAKLGGSQQIYKITAEDILKKISKSLDYCDEKQFKKLTKKVEAKAHVRALEKARAILSPLILRSAQDLAERDWSLMGCYVLVRLDSGISVYVGKSQNAKKRLKQHGRYDLYALKSCGSEREMEDLEMALYHLVKSPLRENDNHPSPAERCPFCGR